VAWTIISSHLRQAATRGAALPGTPGYGHALAAGVTAALTVGAAVTLLALLITIATIRVRRARPTGSTPARSRPAS